MIMINFNMGCIETFLDMMLFCVFHKINFNMGCIETRKQVHRHRRQSRLTLTWDVLKHVLVGVDYLAELRLTLTWDVLKATNVQNIRNKTLFDEM